MQLVTPNISIDAHKEQGAGHARRERCSWRHSGPTVAHPSPVQGLWQQTCSNRTLDSRVPDLSCQTRGSQILSTEWAADLNDPCFGEGTPCWKGGEMKPSTSLPMYLCIHLPLSTCHVAIYDFIICPSTIISITYHLYIIYHLSIHLSPTYAMSSITYLSSLYHLFITYLFYIYIYM